MADEKPTTRPTRTTKQPIIKTEQPTPSTSSSSTLPPRLSSVRPGRGFTLGGAQKMKFAPTVPTKRIQKTGPLSLLDEAKQKKEFGRGKKPGTGRGMGRGRGRDFDADASISSASGPFSLGPAAIGMRAGRPTFSGGGGGGGGGGPGGMRAGGGTGVKREGGGGNGGYNEDDMDDDAVMFNDGLDMHAPITLSSNKKSAVKVKKETDEMGITIGDDVDMEEDGDSPMEDIEYGNVDENRLPFPAGFLLEANNALPDDRLIFFQFPNIFPKLEAAAKKAEKSEMIELENKGSDGSEGSTPFAEGNAPDTHSIAVKTETIDKNGAGHSGSSTISLPSSSSSCTKKETETKPPLDGASPPIPGQDPDGCIGTVQVYKSGKMRLRVGEIVMDITRGSECSFLQNVVVVDPTSREAFMMGNVNQRFIVQPNVKKLMKLC